MSEIIETYQEEQERLASPELPGMAFATVVSVNEDGLELRFDGEEEAASKHYPCNVGVSFSAGQRALLMKVNGSYVALCPVGLQGGGGGGGGGGENYEVFSVGQNGLVPGPNSAETGKYLRGDGEWATPGGGGASISVSSNKRSISVGTVEAQSVVCGTVGDIAPSGAFHMGVVGVYTNNNDLVACAAPTALSDEQGGAATIRYQVANPKTTARSNVYLHIVVRYLSIS